MKEKSYTQLTPEKRYQIYAYLKAGWSQSAMARELSVHKSTISRELKRNRGQRGYRPVQAQQRATARAQQRATARAQERASRPRISATTWQVVRQKLGEQWSPEQISGRLRRQSSQSSQSCGRVSHERIYQYIYADKKAGGTLHRHLRSQKKRRKRYGSGRSRRGQIAGRVCISQRPAIVERRERVGDWEGDTIVGKGHQQAMVSLVERVSRYTLLQKVARKTATAVAGAMKEQLQPLAHKVETVTLDNGREFAAHQEVAQAVAAQTYFAHPYSSWERDSSWERGLNENTNGLVRQYCPKKTDFAPLSQQQVQKIADQLNHRPRKVLDYRTPYEVFFDLQNVALDT